MTPTVTLLSGRLRRSTVDAAGFDLFATEDVTIWSGGRAVIPTGVRLAINPTYFGLIRDRSSLASKFGVVVAAGIVDGDYRDEVGVVVVNTSASPVTIKSGERCAQILFLPVSSDVVAVEGAVVENGGERVGGFGSTGTGR